MRKIIKILFVVAIIIGIGFVALSKTKEVATNEILKSAGLTTEMIEQVSDEDRAKIEAVVEKYMTLDNAKELLSNFGSVDELKKFAVDTLSKEDLQIAYEMYEKYQGITIEEIRENAD